MIYAYNIRGRTDSHYSCSPGKIVILPFTITWHNYNNAFIMLVNYIKLATYYTYL